MKSVRLSKSKALLAGGSSIRHVQIAPQNSKGRYRSSHEISSNSPSSSRADDVAMASVPAYRRSRNGSRGAQYVRLEGS